MQAVSVFVCGVGCAAVFAEALARNNRHLFIKAVGISYSCKIRLILSFLFTYAYLSGLITTYNSFMYRNGNVKNGILFRIGNLLYIDFPKPKIYQFI